MKREFDVLVILILPVLADADFLRASTREPLIEASQAADENRGSNGVLIEPWTYTEYRAL